MSVLGDILSELFGMFVSDARLTAAILALVLIAAVLIDTTDLPPLVGGGVLLLGSIAILVASVGRAARARAQTASKPSE